MNLVTKNNITKGDTVRYIKESKSFPAQNGLARKELKMGKTYEVEFVFPGDPEQIELKGLETLFVYDMFMKVS